MEGMIFWGAAGQAKVLRECMQYASLKLLALFDRNENLVSPFADVPLYFGKKGFRNWLKKIEIPPDQIAFLVAIGGDKGKDRIEIQEYLESQGPRALIARHPTAFIADNVEIGAGTQILANSSICVETVVGRGCIINTKASVDHECHIGDGTHICPGATLAGCIHVGRYVTVGTGAVILPRIDIGDGAIIGAGAVVLEDVLPHTVVVGNPARVIRKTVK